MTMQNMITIVMVSDMSRSVGFYQGTLGLKLKFQSPEWSEFDLGSTTLALHSAKPATERPGAEPVAGTASLGFTVDDLDNTVKDLRTKGVRFVMEPTVRENEGIKLAVAIDPDGLGISFAQVMGHGQSR